MELTILRQSTAIIPLILPLAYGIAFFGVTANRSGKWANWTLRGLSLEHLFLARWRPAQRHLNPIEMATWFEWRRKGLIYPVFALIAFLVCLPFLRHTGDVTGPVRAAAFAASFAVWLLDVNDNVTGTWRYLATRPIGTRDLARIHLRTSMKSILLALSLIPIFAAVHAAGSALLSVADPAMSVHYSGAAVCNSPRAGLIWILGIFGVAMASWALYWSCNLLNVWPLILCFGPWEAEMIFRGVRGEAISDAGQLFPPWVCLSGCAVCILWTAGLFLWARRCRLVTDRELIYALAAWGVMCAVFTTGAANNLWGKSTPGWMLAGMAFLTFVVAPFAAVPLSIHYRRQGETGWLFPS